MNFTCYCSCKPNFFLTITDLFYITLPDRIMQLMDFNNNNVIKCITVSLDQTATMLVFEIQFLK